MDYGVPALQVLVNGVAMASVATCVVVSDRAAPIDRAEVALDRDVSASARVAEGDAVTVGMGFRGAALLRVFGGKVYSLEPGRLVTLTCLDRMRDLAGVRIKQAWRNVTPQEVITWCLERAGVDAYSLGSRAASAQRRHHFLAADEPLPDVLRRVKEAWGLDWDQYADPAGAVHFLPWEESERALIAPVLNLQYGVNLLALEPRPQGTGIAETYLAPWVMHSHRITIRDDRLWGAEVTARVERATHTIDPQKGGRTRLEWTLLPN
jgi:hypothetical protein